MNKFITTTLAMLTAENCVWAEDILFDSSETQEEDSFSSLGEGHCYLYTQPNFQGAMTEIINNYAADATYQEIVERGNPLPQEFIDSGISSWACGPNSLVFIFEDGDVFYFSDQMASSTNSYIFNSDVTTSLGSPIPYMEAYLMPVRQFLRTTMFDEPKCTGSSTMIQYWVGYDQPASWEDNL